MIPCSDDNAQLMQLLLLSPMEELSAFGNELREMKQVRGGSQHPVNRALSQAVSGELPSRRAVNVPQGSLPPELLLSTDGCPRTIDSVRARLTHSRERCQVDCRLQVTG